MLNIYHLLRFLTGSNCHLTNQKPQIYGGNVLIIGHMTCSKCVTFLLSGHLITTWTKRGEGISIKSMLGHVIKGRYHVKFPQLSTRGGEGFKIG